MVHGVFGIGENDWSQRPVQNSENLLHLRMHVKQKANTYWFNP